MATLVVVDDESLVTDFLIFLLESEGHTVHAAANGKEALAVVGQVRPALVVTDLMMPVMSGLELAESLRRSSEFSDLPIILCTAVANPVAQHEQHLFTAILHKPYAPGSLIGLVAGHVAKTT